MPLTSDPFLNCPTDQGRRRRAPSTVRRTEPRTSSWSSRTAWRSVRGTNQRSLNSFRKCSPSSRPPTSPRWSRSNRACSMAPPNGRPRSASQVRGGGGGWQTWSALKSEETEHVTCLCVCMKSFQWKPALFLYPYLSLILTIKQNHRPKSEHSALWSCVGKCRTI